MKPGDTLEAAVWLDGTELPEHRERFERDVRDQMRERCASFNVMHGPVVFHVKQPGDERVPPVPDHIQGPDVRLLVGETTIAGYITPPAPFVAELTEKDLADLRKKTRHEAARVGRILTDDECDAIINELGPDLAAQDTLRN